MRIFVAVYFFIVLLSCQAPRVQAQTTETMTVNFGSNQEPVTYRASGFIGPIGEIQPPSSLFLPLKPKLLSWNRTFSGIQRAMQNNIKYQVKLHNIGTIPATADGNWSNWETLVRNRATEAKNNNYANVEFDIWNEPEIGSYWSGPIDERYFQMWIRAYRIIKEVNPAFLVAGPSSTDYGWTMNTFLPRAKTENTLPDVLTWHELWSDGSGIAQRVENMRTYLQTNNMNIFKISINEYNSDTSARKPGVIVRFMYEFEKAKVDSAAKACWQEGGDWNCEVHLDNTLTYPDQKPRAAWWTYKSYADMTGTLVSVTNPASFAGIASKDDTAQRGYVLLGNFAQIGTVNVNLQNLNQSGFYNPGGSININVQRIPNTETNALTEPISIQNNTISPVNNSATITIPNVQLYDAYLISLSNASTPPTLTPTPTPNIITVYTATTGTGLHQWNFVGNGWESCNGCDYWNNIANQYATMLFTGSRFDFYAAKNNANGIVAVSIDNGPETMIDLYSTTESYSLVWSSPALSSGNHTFKVRATGTKNSSSSGTYASVYAAMITTSTISPSVTPSSTLQPPTTTPTPKPGDSNGDGLVNLTDLTVVLSNFGKVGMALATGDFNNDTNVNLTDLTILLSSFGK